MPVAPVSTSKAAAPSPTSSGASISGSAFGVFLTGGSGTVTNAGTIAGSSDAITFSGSSNDRLVVDPGAVFTGAVSGGGGTNTLELASGTYSLSGINTGSFVNFQNLLVDGGADWSLSGANSAATVTDFGTIAIGGSLDVASAIDPASTGAFQLDAGSSLNVAAALGTKTQMSFLGPARSRSTTRDRSAPASAPILRRTIASGFHGRRSDRSD